MRAGIRWAVVALVASLCACSQASRTSYDTLKLLAGGPQVQVPPAGEIAASPYARILVEGGGVSSVMVLGNDDGGRLAWYGGDGYLLFLRDGLVAGSRGLTHDADDIRIEGDNPFLRLATLGDAPVTVARRYDLREGYRYGVPVEGRLQRRGTQTVEILGTPRTLVHFEETLSGPGVRGSNHYWADPATGFIWKSRQLVAPGTQLEIVQLKPYARPGQGGGDASSRRRESGYPGGPATSPGSSSPRGRGSSDFALVGPKSPGPRLRGDDGGRVGG